MARGDYRFGDSDLAAARLRRLAEVFDAPSRRFVRAAAPDRVSLAVDLGCGPGHTTQLLAEASGALRCVGLDGSVSFVARARAEAGGGASFAVHDVTTEPFPPEAASADLAYARFLSSHLPDLAGAIRAWTSTLRRPGGRLLVDEVEWIRTDVPTFRRYLALVEAVLAARGQRLYVGGALAEATRGVGRIVHDAIATHPVAVRDAAVLFSMNLEALREDPAGRARHSAADLAALAADLAALRDSVRGESAPCWGLRQIAVEV